MRTSLKPWQLYSAIVVALGLGLALYVKIYNPYPLQIDTDVIKESIRIQYIANHGFVGLFLPGDNRPIGYDYIFASIAWAFHMNAGDLLWYSTLLTFPLYSLGVLYFCFGFTRNWDKSLMASIISTLICGYWTLEGPAIVLPDEISLLATLFFFAYYLNRLRNRTGYRQFFIGLFFLFLVNLGYYYMAFIALPLYILCQYYPEQRIGYRRAMLIFSALLLPFGFFFYSLTSGAYLPPLPLIEMFGFFNAAYTAIVLVFYIVGVYTNLKSKNPILFYSVLVFAVILFVPVIAPAFPPLGSTALRGEQLLRPSVALVATAGIFLIARRALPKKQVKAAFVIFLVCSPALLIPYSSWVSSNIEVDEWNGIPFNSFDQNEAQAGIWLRDHGIPGAFIISDLQSALILQSVSGLNGPWNPVTFLSNLSLVDQMYYTLKAANNPAWLSANMSGLGHYPGYYIVIDSRTNESVQAFKPVMTMAFKNWTIWYSHIVISFPIREDPPYSISELPPVYMNSEVEIYNATPA